MDRLTSETVPVLITHQHSTMRQRLHFEDRSASAVRRVRSGVALLLVVGAALSACTHPRSATASSGATGACRFTSSPVPFYQSHDTLYQVWTLPAARAV